MDLLSGEDLIWQGRPSWRAMLAYYVKFGVVALLPLVAAVIVDQSRSNSNLTGYGAIATVVLLVIVFLVGWLRRLATLYAITDRQVLIRHGIVSRSLHSTKVEHVLNIDTKQGIFERMLGIGTVHFDTASSEDFHFDFAGIRHPTKLRHYLEEAMERRREEDAAPVSPPPPAAAG